MKTFSLFALMAALGMGTASLLRTDHQNQFPNPNRNVAQITDAAFRDGLYLGRLAAEHGAEPHLAIGRWSALEDRSSFTAGYQEGYTEYLGGRSASATRGHRAE
jgi:hypothetical protein